MHTPTQTELQPKTATTTTTKTIAAEHSFDGELLWQQEATEFIERFPQRRRPHGTLRPSASAGALYKKGTTNITTLNKRASGGELLTAQQRHQRDLFSGDLGIPEVRSHVGNMVHTFETLAMQRKLADQERAKERAWMLQQQQQWEREQLQLRQSKYMPMLKSAVHTTTYTYDTPTHASSASQHGTSNSKYHQLKRKSHESRQRLIQLSEEQLLAAFSGSGGNKDNKDKRSLASSATTKLTNSCSAQPLPNDGGGVRAQSADGSPVRRHSNLSLHSAAAMRRTTNDDDVLAQQYCHMDDDYRKNLFGTMASRGHAPTLKLATSDRKGAAPWDSARGSRERDIGASIDFDGDHDETFIVNAAFDEIFAGYSGVDDDEEECNEDQMVSLGELDDDIFKSRNPNRINNLDCPGSTPMKLPLIAVGAHKKPPPPPPPALKNIGNSVTAHTASPSTRKRTLKSLAKQKQRSTTLHNLFDRLKATQTKAKRPFTKMSSDSLLTQDQLSIEQMTQTLHKYPTQSVLHREIGEGEAAVEPNASKDIADGDFLRGSTLSQSFVHQLHLRQNKENAKKKKITAPTPPISSKTTQSNSANGVNAVNGTPRPQLSQQLAKSTNELLLDDLAVQARRYQRASGCKRAPPVTPRKQQGVGQASEAAIADVPALQRYKQSGGINRGPLVGAEMTPSGRSDSGNYLRGSAEI